MDRAIKPVCARIGGVEIRVSAEARRGIRRRVRQAVVVAGYVAGISAAALSALAVVQSSLLWPVVVCGGAAGVVLWRCKSCR